MPRKAIFILSAETASALSGLGGSIRQLHIKASAQKGSSGGPLLGLAGKFTVSIECWR